MTNIEAQKIKPEPISTINPDGTSAINFNTDPNYLFNPANQPNRPIYVKLQKFPDKYANTSPLGLLGFGMSTIFLSFCNVNAYKMNTMVVGTAIFYGGIAQFIAGTFEIRKGNTFSGTAFCSYGAFWLSFVTILCGPYVLGTEASVQKSTGCYLLFWAIFTGFMTFATLKHGHVTLKLIFLTLTITFLLLAIAEFAKSTTMTRVGGGTGLLCGAIAFYTACAEVIDGEQGYTFMPI